MKAVLEKKKEELEKAMQELEQQLAKTQEQLVMHRGAWQYNQMLIQELEKEETKSE